MSTDLNDPGIRFDSRVPVPVIESSTEPGVTERVSEGFNRLESGLKPESMVSPNATKETRSMAYGLWPMAYGLWPMATLKPRRSRDQPTVSRHGRNNSITQAAGNR
ncbi:MAG: hypothetical protein HON77_18025 [Gammaproteobacteria bacterium]|nr:hypothetical protein [Gammaproteobacteria bacterium]